MKRWQKPKMTGNVVLLIGPKSPVRDAWLGGSDEPGIEADGALLPEMRRRVGSRYFYKQEGSVFPGVEVPSVPLDLGEAMKHSREVGG